MRSPRTAKDAVLAMTALLFLYSNVHAAPDLGFASQDGGAPGTFLEYAASARSMGMGRAFVGAADDASAVYWNPAGLAQVERKDLVASYSDLYEDSSFGVFNYAHPTVDIGTFGVGLVSLRSGDFERRDASGFQGGSFSTSETALLLSHGMELHSSRLSIGSTIKLIREEVDAFSGSGYGLDLGGMFRMNDLLQFGLSIKNLLAPKITLRDESEKYPFDARLGVQWQALKKLKVTMDLDRAAARSVKPYFGGEWRTNNLLAIRGGLSESEMTAGLGFNFKDWGLDYAFGYNNAASGLDDLGGSHRFGFHFSFGPKAADQQVSLRWQKKGQENLAMLRSKMDQWNGFMNDEMSTLVTATKQVIHKQGYLKASDLYAAQGYISFYEGEFERSVQSLSESLAQDPLNTELAAHLEKVRAQFTEENARKIVAEELKRAKDLYAAADWIGTVKACEKVLSFRPDNIEAAMYLEDAKTRINEPIMREMKIAKAMMERGDYLDAIKSFQKVKEMDPENKEAADAITQAIEALEKQASAQQVDTTEPTNTVSQVYEIPRDSVQSRTLYSQGLSLYSQGKLQEAAAAWEQAIRFDNANTLARNAYNRAQNELRDKQ